MQPASTPVPHPENHLQRHRKYTECHPWTYLRPEAKVASATASDTSSIIPPSIGYMLMSMLAFILTVILAILGTSIASANDQRPFWTEQASFTFDNALYVIGVASNATSVEEGRQAAFDHGLAEIRNYAQVQSLDNLHVYTEMTFEEPQRNAKVSVWRLLRVSKDELRMVVKVAGGRPLSLKTAPTVKDTGKASVTPLPVTPLPSPVERQAVRTALPMTKTQATAPAQRLDLPGSSLPLTALPPRMIHVINGWTRDSHGLISVDAEEKRDWYVPTLKPSDLTYSR
jgi:hypothetical protein